MWLCLQSMVSTSSRDYRFRLPTVFQFTGQVSAMDFTLSAISCRLARPWRSFPVPAAAGVAVLEAMFAAVSAPAGNELYFPLAIIR